MKARASTTLASWMKTVLTARLLVTLALMVCSNGPAWPSSSPSSAQLSADPVAEAPPPAGLKKINHIIWIMQENRTFDNYFGTFPGADGIPPSTCLSKSPGGTDCVKPFHMPNLFPTCDLPHEWEHAHAAYDNGRMDGFVWVEGTPYTMGYLDDHDIPNYWEYARKYALADAFFSSQMSEQLIISTWSRLNREA